MASHEISVSSQTQNQHYIGTMMGKVESSDDGLQITCTSDQTVFPLAITGAALLPPLPAAELTWHVFPRTESNGLIAGFKTWKHETSKVSNSGDTEGWSFTGQIHQVSARNQLISIEVKIQQPKSQALRLTLKTPATAHFELGQQWKLRAVRDGRNFTIASAHCLSPIVKILSAADLAGNPSAAPSASVTSTADNPVIQSVWAALQQMNPDDDWSINSLAPRKDVHWHVPVWECDATSTNGKRARVKLSQVDDRIAVYPFPTPEAKEATDRLSVIPLGAARSIGASCFRILIGPYEVVLDAGTRPKGNNPLPAFELLDQPDLLLITHAHQDHLGALPVFHADFPGTPMFCTLGTRELAHVMLSDGLNVQQRNEDSEPLFDEADLERSLFHLQTQPVGIDFEPLPGLTVRFIHAGHIVGAACIYLRYGERSLIYTGDYHIANSRTTDGLRIADLPKADVLITESTYGNTSHPGRKQQERELIEAVTEVVQQGGNVLIPAFALGRAQELILAFRLSDTFRHLGVPIYLDGLVRAVTDCFRSHLPLLPESVQRFAQTQEPFFSDKSPEIIPIESARDRPLAIARPSVVIASSGMLTGGASVHYAQILLERENAALFISGYTDEESPGRRVQALQTGSIIELAGRDITVRAQVRRFSLSAHADKVGICQVIEQVSPRSLILIHGSQDALHHLAYSSDLQKKYLVSIPSVGEEIAVDAVPKQLGSQRREQIARTQADLPAEFEIALEAEVEEGWLKIPATVSDADPRWLKLTQTGYLKARWIGEQLTLTRIPNPTSWSQIHSEQENCCARCQFYQDGRCDCPDSALYQRVIDQSGKCPEFFPQ
jgi:Cft2 family RNA processing exonuclease